MLIEPVTGTLRLTGLEGARRVTAQPLTATGRPLGEPLAARREGDGWAIDVGTPATTAYLVRVEH